MIGGVVGDLVQAHRAIVVLGDYEWEFERALVAIAPDRGTVEIWYEDEGGAQRRVATAPIGATFVEWEDIAGLPGAEEADEG